MGFASRLLWRTAVRKGFFGGSRTWMTVFAVVGLTRVFRRLAGSTQDVVYVENLEPGEALIITHHADLRLGDKQR